MHITHSLKMNIFTGLWHRTLPTLHSMSATPHHPPLNYKSQPVHPPLQPLDSCWLKKERNEPQF